MQPYRWASWGDVNAFFGLMLDNVAVMGILLGAVTSGLTVAEQAARGQIGFTTDFVLTRMIPGTAIGVLIGDLVYTWMAFRLAQKTGNPEVTAMPLGLDTPSTFGVAFFILLPALRVGWNRLADSEGMDVATRHTEAMEFAWHVGLSTLVMVGIFKLFCAPFGNAIRRIVPRAGLLGSLAAIALALIAFLPMLLDGIAGVPLVGMLALLVILITLVAHRDLPGKFPGALAAVLLGALIYFVCRPLGLVPPMTDSAPALRCDPAGVLSFYQRDWAWWSAVLTTSLGYLPVAIPFALATVVGGIDCTESAATVGDEYDTSAVLWVEGAASLIAGLLGGVIQTTPYIGHPAYKKMGGRAAYTLATALFIGVVGLTGGVSFLFAVFPKAALFPILVFVGVEITASSFHHTPARHSPSLALATLPALAALCSIVIGTIFGPALPSDEHALTVMQTLRCLASGFLITGLLWAAALVMILEGQLRHAAVYLLIAAAFAFFGVIHSPLVPEKIDLPWRVMEEVGKTKFVEAVKYQSPYHWSAAYALMALLLWGLSFAPTPVRPEEEPLPASGLGHTEDRDQKSEIRIQRPPQSDASPGPVPPPAGCSFGF
jgi:AGZA family xanthine/uracil permease-like MFS transporter